MRNATEATKLAAESAAAATSAWVTVKSWTYKGIEKDRAVFEVSLKNVGKIPALEAGTGWEFHFMPSPDITLIPKIERAPEIRTV